MIRQNLSIQRLSFLGYCLCAVAFVGSFAAALRGEVNGAIELGPVEVIGDDYEIAVFIEFESDADPEEEAVFFAVDLASSDASVTEDGEDYSAFEFVKDLQLSEWEQIPGTGFGDEPLETAVEYDTITQPLTPGRYQLGSLIFDRSRVDASVFPATISLASPGTTIGVQEPGNSPTFDFVELDFSNATAVIPEPSAQALLLIAFPLLHVFRKRHRPGKATS